MPSEPLKAARLHRVLQTKLGYKNISFASYSEELAPIPGKLTFDLHTRSNTHTK